MNKTYGLLSLILILAIVLASGLVSYARVENPADPATVQTPWVGNVDAGGFNLSSVGTLGVTTLTAGTVTVSSYAVSPFLVGGAATSTITGNGTLSTIGGALSVTANFIVGTTSTFTGASVHTAGVTFNDDVAFGAGDTISFTPQTISVSTSSTSIDIGSGNKLHVTLATTTTFIFVDPANAGNITIKLIQDGVGSRTVTWPAEVKWPSDTAPTLTTTSSSIDFVSCYHDGTNYYCTDSLDFQ